MSHKPTLYAVFIGINGYKSNPLAGSVNDVLMAADYFKKLSNTPSPQEPQFNWEPLYLLAPNSDSDFQEIEKRNLSGQYHSPTRQQIIDAFTHFKKADPERGDFCLLYYSGHGSYLPVPEMFKDVEPSGQLQTIVCLDSRDPGQHDLLDKEIGYLIADALENKAPYDDGGATRKGVHFLAIMDCCHAGSNTRGDEPDRTARMVKSGTVMDTPEQVLGFTRTGNCFYAPFEPGQTRLRPENLKPARHVSLAAARDSELATEMPFFTVESIDGVQKNIKKRHGVFTYSLLATLEQSGANISYRDLIRRAEIEIRSRIDRQIPVLSYSTFHDENLFFLRNEFQTPKQIFEVGRRMTRDGLEWFINAGAMQGIQPSTPGSTTTVRLTDGRVVGVINVQSAESLLDPAVFTEADRSDLLLRATIHQMARPKIKVALAPEAHLAPAMRSRLETALQTVQLEHVEIIPADRQPDYLIKSVGNPDLDGSFILTRPGSDLPLFKRREVPGIFLRDVDKVGKWETTLKISNPDTGIARQEIRVDISCMEGEAISPQTLTALINTPDKWTQFPPNPEDVTVRHARGFQPAIKVRITNCSQWSGYWVGGLYLDSQFGISPDYLPVRELTVNQFTNLNFVYNGVKFEAIPVQMDQIYHDFGINEIQDYILLFVSKQPFDLADFRQTAIEADTKRGSGFEAVFGGKTDDWFTIKIPVHIINPLGTITISGNKSEDFPGRQQSIQPTGTPVLKIKGPEGFSAVVQPASLAGAQRQAGDGATTRSAGDVQSLLPPGMLWAGSEGSESVFSKGMAAASPDNHLSILELTNVTGSIQEDRPLVITPGEQLPNDETILPFGYDVETGLYYPIGYTDEHGDVLITQLPRESPGRIGAGDTQTRSLGGSIKLFFHKLVWSKLTGRQDYNTLTLIRRNADGSLEKTAFNGTRDSADQASAAAIQQAVSTGKVLLLIHGIIGDNENKIDWIFNHSTLYEDYTILAFDYENLDTPIQTTAGRLHKMLSDCQLPPQSLTILAHSMGGLVSRWMIEQVDGGKAPVKCLVQVGTPNGGSEISDFRHKLLGWISLGLNGVDAFKPWLAPCGFLLKGVAGKLFHTLDEMQPGSPFLKKLNAEGKQTPGIPYYLLAGDTSEIEAAFDTTDPAWKKLVTCLQERGKYIFADYLFFSDRPNDMAVRVESMHELPWGRHDQSDTIPCDHLHYFDNANGRRVVESWLRG